MYRAPYYPQTQVEESVTRFGTIETNCKNLYETPISGKTIYRVDLLEALVDMWGSNVLMSRDLTYCLVSGSCTDDKYRSVIKSYYKKFIAFGNYINHIFIFGDKSLPYITRIIKPARAAIDEYYQTVCEEIENTGAKYLMRTHEYVYFAVPATVHYETALKGVKIIC